MIIEIEVREGAKAPNRANPSDAGLDVFYCPTDPNVRAVSVMPGKNQLLPTGLKFGVPHGYMLQVCNRSSMGAKKSLVVGAHIVDSGYDGEVFIDLHNIGTGEQFISAGAKIAQLVLVPVVHFRPRLVAAGNLYGEEISMSGRGPGALGSTDKIIERTRITSTADLDIRDKYPKKRNVDKKISDSLKDWLPSGF